MGFTIKCNTCENQVTINNYEDKDKLQNGELSIYICTDGDWYDEIRCDKCGSKIAKV